MHRRLEEDNNKLSDYEKYTNFLNFDIVNDKLEHFVIHSTAIVRLKIFYSCKINKSIKYTHQSFYADSEEEALTTCWDLSSHVEKFVYCRPENEEFCNNLYRIVELDSYDPTVAFLFKSNYSIMLSLPVLNFYLSKYNKNVHCTFETALTNFFHLINKNPYFLKYFCPKLFENQSVVLIDHADLYVKPKDMYKVYFPLRSFTDLKPAFAEESTIVRREMQFYLPKAFSIFKEHSLYPLLCHEKFESLLSSKLLQIIPDAISRKFFVANSPINYYCFYYVKEHDVAIPLAVPLKPTFGGLYRTK